MWNIGTFANPWWKIYRFPPKCWRTSEDFPGRLNHSWVDSEKVGRWKIDLAQSRLQERDAISFAHLGWPWSWTFTGTVPESVTWLENLPHGYSGFHCGHWRCPNGGFVRKILHRIHTLFVGFLMSMLNPLFWDEWAEKSKNARHPQLPTETQPDALINQQGMVMHGPMLARYIGAVQNQAFVTVLRGSRTLTHVCAWQSYKSSPMLTWIRILCLSSHGVCIFALLVYRTWI